MEKNHHGNKVVVHPLCDLNLLIPQKIPVDSHHLGSSDAVSWQYLGDVTAPKPFPTKVGSVAQT